MRLKHPLPAIDSQEPVGIVIADGGRGDAPTRFSAFVWGPVPEDEPVVVSAPRGVLVGHA